MKLASGIKSGKENFGIMEAMKMEHEIISSVSGTVEEINVSNLDTVFEGHSLMTIKLGEVKKKKPAKMIR